jgi:hypothetical protein
MRYEGDLDCLRTSVRLVRLQAPIPSLLPPMSNSPATDAPDTPAESVPETERFPSSSASESASVSQSRSIVPCYTKADSNISSTALASQPPPVPAPSPPDDITGQLQFIVPDGFTALRDETQEGTRSLVLRAAPASWQAFDIPGAEICELSLEDIFISLVGNPVATI